jgi:hypothetical protein
VDTYRLTVYAHLVLAVVLMGMALFWLIMRLALREKFGADGAGRWLELAREARWPHVGLPYRLRLPLPWVSWALLFGLVLTGLLLVRVHGAPGGMFWNAKAALTLALAIALGLLGRRVAPGAVQAVFWLTLATIVVSGWVLRT